jgi:molybdopterin-guanine dinucleotide biosynthesis protein A
LRGWPLIAYALEAATATGLEVAVMAKRHTSLPHLEARVVHEPDEPSHPLCGILAALRTASGPVVALGCDMPFVTPALLSRLAGSPEPLTLPRTHGQLHPLVARYTPELAPALEASMMRGEPLQRAVRSLEPQVLDWEELAKLGDPDRLLFNVNTPSDVEQAERLLAKA